MNDYEIELINKDSYGVIRYYYYQIKDYDGNVEKLEEYVKKLNEESMFNIDWYIKDKEKGILEKVIDTLD